MEIKFAKAIGRSNEQQAGALEQVNRYIKECVVVYEAKPSTERPCWHREKWEQQLQKSPLLQSKLLTIYVHSPI